jgi:predicted enzyme related to lactoylglutathione lyase
MQINNAIASLPVKDLNAARQWYEKLIGRASTSPMPTLCEWTFPNGGGLQVYEGPDRAGGGSCTLPVANIEDTVAELKRLGIDAGKRMGGEKAEVVMISDPDGNGIAFAQAMDQMLKR